MDTLLSPLYIFAAIFGVGSVLLEMSGVLGDWGEDAGDGDAGSNGDGADEGGAEDEATELPRGTRQPPPPAGPGGGTARGLFSLLRYVRMAVFFALGFGLVGWVSLLAGIEPLESLVFSLPAGLLSLATIVGIFRLARREFDSGIRDFELVGRGADVLVSIEPREMGRIRIQLEQLTQERYARGANPDASYPKGTHVLVSKVGEDCVYVRAPSETEAATNNTNSNYRKEEQRWP